MAYRILEHTADVRLLVEGRTLEELFQEALGGMMEVLKPEKKEGGAERLRRIEVEAASRTALLVDFLNEALWLAHCHKEMLVLARIEVTQGDAVPDEKDAQAGMPAPLRTETRVEATLRGWPAEAFGEDIKAVTYHEAEIRQNAAGNLETKLVFDI